MTDIPIIFSAPMVQALLAGRKTMTRRLAWKMDCGNRVQWRPSPWQKVQPSDRLWVREAWKPHSIYANMKPRDMPKSKVFYLADDRYKPSNIPGLPSIHMPRWASRLTLIVTATKIERLQDISEGDSISEGIERVNPGPFGWCDYEWNDRPERGTGAVTSFMTLWDSIHGANGWTSNPEVVALTFRVVRENIDHIKDAA